MTSKSALPQLLHDPLKKNPCELLGSDQCAGLLLCDVLSWIPMIFSWTTLVTLRQIWWITWNCGQLVALWFAIWSRGMNKVLFKQQLDYMMLHFQCCWHLVMLKWGDHNQFIDVDFALWFLCNLSATKLKPILWRLKAWPYLIGTMSVLLSDFGHYRRT